MNQFNSNWRQMEPDVKREIVKWILQATAGLVAYGLILFLAAGRRDWIWGWVHLVILAHFLAAHPLLLSPTNPGLLAEGEKGIRAEGVRSCDRWLAGLAGGMMPPVWAVAGLDQRFQWTGWMLLVSHIGGMAASLLAYALRLWVTVSNAYFSEGVKIQTERGHEVAT